MLPLVAIMVVCPFIPLLGYIHSKEPDIIVETKFDNPALEITVVIVGTVIRLTMDIYFFLVSLGGWKSVKEY